MATIKSFTSLEQSKKLAEFLPLESADMYYSKYDTVHANMLYGSCDNEYFDIHEYIPCWSLVSLLEIIKKLVGYSLQSLDTHTVFMNCELGDKPYNIETENYDNPIDACYDMIIHLNELNIL